MKKILGLDLGTNSIGWAVVDESEQTDGHLQHKIEAAGSRILPMDAAMLGDFNKGNTVSQTKARTMFRGTRRLLERNLLRRERLLRVLDTMNFLPEHYACQVDRYGHFKLGTEPKIAWENIAEHKYEFIFKDSFNEMVDDFKKNQPQLFRRKPNGEETKIPYDWTLYYLRKKALTKKISKQELSWILLSFNQKRGYYQLRDDVAAEKNDVKSEEVKYCKLKVIDVQDSGDKKGDDVWYNVYLENGWIYRRSSRVKLDWVGKTKDFIVTTALDDNGNPKTDKDGAVKRSFRAPKDDDWMLMKTKTEFDIEQSKKTVGEYIYDTLLQKPEQKIKGALIRVVERDFYKDELKRILEKQKEFHNELQNDQLYLKCIEELYGSNQAYRDSIAQRDFTYLFVDNIIFYQRPLKSKKSLISNCPYEERLDKEGVKYPVKCIPQSNPLFQEFRLWQFISNLKIFQREKEIDGKLCTDVDVTNQFLGKEEDYVNLFDWLNNRKDIEQNVLFGTYFKIKKAKGKASQYIYRWNYVEDKKYPCNSTYALMTQKMAEAGLELSILKANDNEMRLWHILYSINDKIEIAKALHSFAKYCKMNNQEADLFVAAFKNYPKYEKNYGAYSEKAIKKLLPLMRMGKYWNADSIDAQTKQRINKIINGEYDEHIGERVREKAILLKDINDFRGLPLWLACYVVYDRHSEAKDLIKWDKPADIDAYLKEFRQYSLRNPVVEQVLTETLRTVRDIWNKVGRIDEIHIELGREMKQTAEKRKTDSKRIYENENTAQRIRVMLNEFANSGMLNVRPYSPGQQELLHIYEDYAVSNLRDDDKEHDFIVEISKNANPSSSDVNKYRLWLEQQYRSPYTGEIIRLSELFTPMYEIEHIIPQSRYFDDSFTNKVICESEINKLKDNSLGREFICKHHGEKVTLGFGKTVEVFSVEAYESFVKEHYSKDGSSKIKMKKLLLDDIPDEFIERQLNDNRYVSKIIKSILSNIVREESEQEAISKNVIVCSGSITDCLKKDWGLSNVWSNMMLPRFKRMNEITGEECFVAKNSEGHEIPNMPLELQKGFKLKRIDHRHHALDAIVIACTTRSHVNLLNNESAKSANRANRYQLSHKLRRYEKVEYVKNGERVQRDVPKEFIKPWGTFSSDVQRVLSNVIVSFKHNQRVINKTTNKYLHFMNGKKAIVRQEKGDNWAIRKSLHKDTVFGEVNLRKDKTVSLSVALKNVSAIVESDFKQKVKELLSQGLDAKHIKSYFTENSDVWKDIDLAKIKIYYFTKDSSENYFATRKPIDDSFTQEKIEHEITDTGIQKILLKHLNDNAGNHEVAFSPEGIDTMNRNIIQLNGWKYHKPIRKVRWYEKGDKFAVGTSGNKSSKFVEADKGTNLFFAVYEPAPGDDESKNKKRVFETIPLNVVIDRQKHGLPVAPEFDDNGNKLLFVLSPGDLVYLPTISQSGAFNIDDIVTSRIYKFVDSSDKTANFVPHSSASVIFSLSKKEQQKRNIHFIIQDEYGVNSPQSKNQRALTGEMIKETCIPLKVNRLGEIIGI